MGAVAQPQVIGRYAVYGKIASGGMASVCFGRLLGGEGFARTVAIKRLHPHLAEDPEFRATLIDEARMAARIHHPNVVPTLDVVTADGELLLVMEYVRGESLARLLKIERGRSRRVPLHIVSAIGSGALNGLHAAHEATSDSGEPLGIVHRDVSPQNLLVGVDGLARVIDFGVAKAAGRVQTTREGSIKGKIAYMAPEQISGHSVSRRADVYAMGVVLWEMLSGERLFQAENDVALVARVIAGAQDAPSFYAPQITPGLDELVMRALATDPSDRFGTTEEMAVRLVRLVPPALATDVGKWVEEAARATLSQRGAELAEIESASGISLIPQPPTSARALDNTGSISRRGMTPTPLSRRAVAQDPTRVASISGGYPRGPGASGGYPRPAGTSGGYPQTTGEHSLGAAGQVEASTGRSISLLGMPKPSLPPVQRSQLGIWAGALCVAALLGLGLAVLLRGATSPPMRGTSPATAPATSDPPRPPPTPASTGTPAAEPGPVVAAPPATGQSPAAVPVTALPAAPAPPSPSPRPSPRPPRPGVNVQPTPGTVTAPAAKPKPSCNPPYVIDSAGDRQYKPECL